MPKRRGRPKGKAPPKPISIKSGYVRLEDVKFYKQSDPVRLKFLFALAIGASVARACQVADIDRTTAYQWREADPIFAELWQQAFDIGTDTLEDEAVRRGRDGTAKPVFHKGEICGYIQEYSDTLLIFMLKARRPLVYQQAKADKDGGDEGGGAPAILIKGGLPE